MYKFKKIQLEQLGKVFPSLFYVNFFIPIYFIKCIKFLIFYNSLHLIFLKYIYYSY